MDGVVRPRAPRPAGPAAIANARNFFVGVTTQMLGEYASYLESLGFSEVLRVTEPAAEVKDGGSGSSKAPPPRSLVIDVGATAVTLPPLSLFLSKPIGDRILLLQLSFKDLFVCVDVYFTRQFSAGIRQPAIRGVATAKPENSKFAWWFLVLFVFFFFFFFLFFFFRPTRFWLNPHTQTHTHTQITIHSYGSSTTHSAISFVCLFHF
jgi:hypothetical protein